MPNNPNIIGNGIAPRTLEDDKTTGRIALKFFCFDENGRVVLKAPNQLEK